MDVLPSKEIRRANLNLFVGEEELVGRQRNEVANALSMAPSYLSQLLHGHSVIGDSVRSKIETCLCLVDGALDTKWESWSVAKALFAVPPTKGTLKRRPGRPPKPEDEALLQFSIRLPAKLKFALDILARFQGRSLSQAMEWALQTALANTPVRQGGAMLWDGINTSWERDGWQRTYALFTLYPSLCTFEERHACGLIDGSAEHQFVRSGCDPLIESKWLQIVSSEWAALLSDASFGMPIGSMNTKSLCARLGLVPVDSPMSMAEQIAAAAAAIAARGTTLATSE